MSSTPGSPSSVIKKNTIWTSLWSLDYEYGKRQKTGLGKDVAGTQPGT